MSSMVGRADLVRFLGCGLDEGEIERLGRRLGWHFEEIIEPQSKRAHPTPGAGSRAPQGGEPQPVALPKRPSSLPFRERPLLLLARVERLKPAPPPSEAVQPIAYSRLGPGSPAPASRSITPWSRVWPPLQEALRALFPSSEVDADALAERLSRGDSIQRLPYRQRRSWAVRLIVVTDRSARLAPFWGDQDRVLARLEPLLGSRGVFHLTVRGELDHAASLPQGAPILVLGDLGHWGTGEQRESWRVWGRRRTTAGHRLVALVPFPANEPSRALRANWRLISWDAGRAAVADLDQRRRSAELLFRLLAPAFALEAGLLRAVRRLLPAADADAATEGELWRHPWVDRRVGSVLWLREERRLALREAMPELEEAHHPLLPQVFELLFLTWHARRRAGGGLDFSTSPEIWAEEVVSVPEALHELLPAGVLEEARRILASSLMLASQAVGERASTVPLLMALSYQRGVLERAREDWWSAEQLGDSLRRTTLAINGGRVPDDLPPGASPSDFGQTGSSTGPIANYELWQQGLEITAGQIAPQPELPRRDDEPVLPHERGVRFGALRARSSALLVTQGRVRRSAALGDLTPFKLAMDATHSLRIESDLERLVFEPFPGAGGRPSWATGTGQDRFGFFADLDLGGLAHRLRWVPAGSFLMGSPAEEPGRWEDEGPVREVQLTRGFWLGETAVTQDVWESVMGHNPSRFQSARRPVEQVSWEDCQEFFARAESVVPGLGLRLPTEAEWEYASRAGTKEATYAGPMEIRGEHNAQVLDRIAWYGGNSGVDFDLDEGADASSWREKQHEFATAGTHEVMGKAPNGWGLYDMLGNVWECCADWWSGGGYEGAEVVDPKGPSRGPERVIRGGSWRDVARLVRAAARSRSAPDERFDALGFRLARGQD